MQNYNNILKDKSAKDRFFPLYNPMNLLMSKFEKDFIRPRHILILVLFSLLNLLYDFN